MRKFFLFLHFFLLEIKLIKKNIRFLISFFKNVSIFKILGKIVKNDQKPIFLNKDLNEYLMHNLSHWKSLKSNSKKFILIDLTLSTHPTYTIIQCILGNNFKKITGYECKVIINQYDILTKFIAKSFCINNFVFLKKENIFRRLYYFNKSLELINLQKNLKKLISLKKEKIEIGKAAYEFTVRNYIKDLSFKKSLFFFYISLAKSLYILNQTNKIFKMKNIKLLLMAETQFLPNRIFFQKSLLKKIPIYSFYGGRKENQISIRCFDGVDSFNQHRMKFSDKLLDYFLKKKKFQLKKKINKFIKSEIYKNPIGSGEKIYSKQASKKKIFNINNYNNFCKKYGFNNKLKTVIILPNVFVDNLFTHKWSIFYDPIDWYLSTLEIIKKIKNVNWLIKSHPSEKIYNTEINAKNLYSQVITEKYENINFLDENHRLNNLTKHISTVITFGGSAGYEYTYFGKQVITVGDNRYSNFKLSISPKNLKEYKFILHNLNKPVKVNKITKFKAGMYWYMIKSLTRLPNNLIPITLTRRNFFDESYWKVALKTFDNRKSLDENDNFYNHLLIMYKFKNRHSIDLKKLFQKNKKFQLVLNDVKD